LKSLAPRFPLAFRRWFVRPTWATGVLGGCNAMYTPLAGFRAATGHRRERLPLSPSGASFLVCPSTILQKCHPPDPEFPNTKIHAGLAASRGGLAMAAI
jgi:hypothetical protein